MILKPRRGAQSKNANQWQINERQIESGGYADIETLCG